MKQEFKYLRAQWHSQPKILSGSKYLILGKATVFCLRYCLLKHKMTSYSKNLEGPWPAGYVYVRAVYIT